MSHSWTLIDLTGVVRPHSCQKLTYIIRTVIQAVLVHTRVICSQISFAMLGRECSSAGVSDATIIHTRPNMKKNRVERKAEVRWTENIDTLYCGETGNKFEKITSSCQGIHYKTLTNSVPTYHENQREIIAAKHKFHWQANRKWTSQKVKKKRNFPIHSSLTKGRTSTPPQHSPIVKFLISIPSLRLK